MPVLALLEAVVAAGTMGAALAVMHPFPSPFKFSSHPSLPPLQILRQHPLTPGLLVLVLLLQVGGVQWVKCPPSPSL
jgi:hypothetical protein